MLRTVLLLDGSAAMNLSTDYLPSYLLASRPPMLQFVNDYLDSTPLASLGLIVMRHGIAVKLLSPTTNASELIHTLEQEYFLYGGAGALSLENGLRMALSELAQLKPHKKESSLLASSTTQNNNNNPRATRRKTRTLLHPHTMQPRVVLLSAAVTLIDPTDVLKIIHVMSALQIRIDIISFNGAVHVFEECARRTGGLLSCPLNYDHLHRIMKEMALVTSARVHYSHRNKRNRYQNNINNTTNNTNNVINDNNKDNDGDDTASPMIPIGFPIYLHRAFTKVTPPPPLSKIKSETRYQSSTSSCHKLVARYLACPRCHLIQTSIPSTCALCKLLLCSVPMMYSTFILHNPACCAPVTLLDNSTIENNISNTLTKEETDSSNEERAENKKKKNKKDEEAAEEAAVEGVVESENKIESGVIFCSTCACPLDCRRDAQFRCTSCLAIRCETCRSFIAQQLQLCPTCVALK